MAKEKPPPPPEALVAAANVRLVLAALDALDWSAMDRPRLLRLLGEARDAIDLLIGASRPRKVTDHPRPDAGPRGSCP